MNIKALSVLVCIVASPLALASEVTSDTAMTTGQAKDWKSETHCISLSKAAGYPEYDVKIQPPKEETLTTFSYQLGFTDGFIRATSITLGKSTKETARLIFNEQCAD